MDRSAMHHSPALRRPSQRRGARPAVGAAVAAFAIAVLAACGGSGGGGNDNGGASSGSGSTTPTPAANTLAVTVDQGPAALASAGEVGANILYATVTVCTPGTTTCRAIDHVQVDTGSTGLRLLASTLTGIAPGAVTDATTGLPLRECVQFADGYSYGSVGTVDASFGGRTIAGLPIQVIGDAAAGTAPSSCASGPAESDVAAFGANGILGLGHFLQDCGSACATRAVTGFYYVCPSTGCTPAVVPLAQQLANPVSKLATDNNGIVVKLGSVPSPGAATVSGTVYFGIGTQADNAFANATVYKLSSQATFTATSNGATYANSFIDSGSNAYFFASSIRVCPDATFFYCPVTSSGAATSVTRSATIAGTNGVSTTVTIQVDNADSLFATNDTAYPGLAGPNGALVNGTTGGAFDFGLPFFYGRTVYVVIEGSSLNGVAGPAIAF